MTTKLTVYNLALLELGERAIASLSEARPPRYALDDAYDSALLYALEQGLWNFAMRGQAIDYDAGIDPGFGYDYGFEKPSDLIRLNTLTSDANGLNPLEEFADEAGYWYANVETVYTTYVSNDASYGLDLTKWTATFERYFALLLAERICSRETSSETKLERIKRDCKRALVDARSKDAMAGPNYYRDKSNWLRARNSGSRLIGTGRGL